MDGRILQCFVHQDTGTGIPGTGRRASLPCVYSQTSVYYYQGLCFNAIFVQSFSTLSELNQSLADAGGVFRGFARKSPVRTVCSDPDQAGHRPHRVNSCVCFVVFG